MLDLRTRIAQTIRPDAFEEVSKLPRSTRLFVQEEARKSADRLIEKMLKSVSQSDLEQAFS